MNRLVIAGIFALAASGCGQLRSALPPQPGGSAPVGPLALAPIHETINGGFGPAPRLPGQTEPAPVIVQEKGSRSQIDTKGADSIEPPRLLAKLPEPAVKPKSDPLPATLEPPTLETASNAEPTRDPKLLKTLVDEVVQPVSTRPSDLGKPVSEWAARVNDDIITMNELRAALKERMRQMSDGQSLPPDSLNLMIDGLLGLQPMPEGQEFPAEAREMFIDSVLDWLIDRTLIIQRARQEELKNPKAWENINQAAENVWDEEMLGPLMKRYEVSDKYELARAMAALGDSLDDMKDSFKLDFISRQYLVHKVRPKIHVDLPELRSYYQENRNHEVFQNREKIEWSEVVVHERNHPDPAEALSKVEQALARIAGGDDFSEVAKDLSEGPTAAQGGQHSTSPGSYAVETVNQALNSLPVGQVSPIIRGPQTATYHIVRVDRRLQAGPKPFEDVQKPIRDILEKQKETEQIDAYLAALHKGSVVKTIFKEYKAEQQ